MKEIISFKKKSWKAGVLPSKTAIFVIGDLHGEYILLDKMLREINKEIKKLPKLVNKEIIFIGDYIDRGLNSKKTISVLIELKKKYLQYKRINIHYICGNHDEFFSKIIFSKGIIKEPQDNRFFNIDPLYKLMRSSCNYVYITGFKAWFNVGGGKTTVRDYCPEILHELESIINHINDDKQEKYIKLNYLINKLKESIPKTHKSFFKNIINNYYLIIGEYLFIHAGVNPKKKLIYQGIGKNSKKLIEYEYIELLMIRDPFLWIDKLNNCPLYVIHGHTPSTQIKNNIIIADCRKDYRLCLDTKVYNEQGSLTCFFKFKNNNKFISISKKNTDIKTIY